eukprot:jgi/Phyca11/98227/e_gw1.2.1356.1
MLYLLFTRLCQLSSKQPPCERIPRISPPLAEAERPFNLDYCSRNPKVFRDAYRVNRPVFDALLEAGNPYITDPVRSRRELLGVTLNWLVLGASARAQEH